MTVEFGDFAGDGGAPPAHHRVGRCPLCGRFARELFIVWGQHPESGPEYEACKECL